MRELWEAKNRFSLALSATRWADLHPTKWNRLQVWGKVAKAGRAVETLLEALDPSIIEETNLHMIQDDIVGLLPPWQQKDFRAVAVLSRPEEVPRLIRNFRIDEIVHCKPGLQYDKLGTPTKMREEGN